MRSSQFIPSGFTLIGATPPIAPPDFDVEPDALVLTPCLTKERFIHQAPTYYAKGYKNLTDAALRELIQRDTADARYDNLDCMIRMSGKTVPAQWMRCATPQKCMEVLSHIEKEGDSFLDVIASFIAPKVIPFLMRLAPFIGEVITSAVAPLMAEMLASFSTNAVLTLSDEVKAITDTLTNAANKVFEYVADPETRASIRQTFNSLGVSSKSLTDALKPAGINVSDPRTMLAYVATHSGLGFAQEVLSGKQDAMHMLQAMAVNGSVRIYDYASAKVSRDLKKSLVTVQASMAFTNEKRGKMTAGELQNFLSMNMPAPGDLKRPEDLRGFPLEVSNNMVEKFSGDPKKMVGALNAEQLAQIVPDGAQRASFTNDLQKAIAFDNALAPTLLSVEQQLGKDLDAIGVELKEQRKRLPMGSFETPELRVKRDAWRGRVEAAYRRADSTIFNAAETLRIQTDPAYAAQRTAVNNAWTNAIAKGCITNPRGGFSCPPAYTWPLEKGVV